MGTESTSSGRSVRARASRNRSSALDADSGKIVWDYKINLFQSDVPPHRIAWASPAADPETGNIYALSGGAQVIALSRDGKPLWNRSFGEEFAAFTTHGGRTMSPLVDGDLVIVSAAVSNWGTAGNRSHRLNRARQADRRGDLRGQPGRPARYDTAYGAPLIATINGQRLLIVGLGDGAVHAIKPQTGERGVELRRVEARHQHGVAVKDNIVFLSHGDENLTGNELGLRRHRRLAERRDQGAEVGGQGTELNFSSPIIDGTRIYQIDNSSTLRAWDTGNRQAAVDAGSQHRPEGAPGVMADGKLYVGNDAGSSS